MDLDRFPPSTERDNMSREGAGAMWLAVLAMLLVISGIVVLGVPIAGVALWLGIKAQRSRSRASGPALTAVVLGMFGVLIGVGGPAIIVALKVYGDRQMPALIAEHEGRLRPEFREAADGVFPCEGRIDSVELQSLYTQWPQFGGRPALTLDEAGVAYVDVVVQGERYTVDMIGSANTGWGVNNRMGLTAACEDAADPSG